MLRLTYIISLCCMSRNQKTDHEEIEETVVFPSILFQQVLFMEEWSCLSITKHYFNLKPLLPVRQNDETIPSKGEFKGIWNSLKWTQLQGETTHFSNGGRRAEVEITVILHWCCTARRHWRKEQKVKSEGGWDKARLWLEPQWVWLIANTLAQRQWSILNGQQLVLQQLQNRFALYFLPCLMKDSQVHGSATHQTFLPTQVNSLPMQHPPNTYGGQQPR